MNFIAMDFETANYSPESACSLALVMVQQDKIVGEYYQLINPKMPFYSRNIQIHGIREEDVKDAPTFPEMWAEIAHLYQEHHLIAAHNAPFDNGVLRTCLKKYELTVPKYLSIDTVKTSKKLFPTWDNHRLDTCCKNLNITLLHHHDALEDSRACAEILLKESQLFGPNALKPFAKVEN